MSVSLLEGLAGKWLAYNDELIRIADPRHRADDFVTSGSVVYEVIRLRAGVPLFWREHLERMNKSLVSAGIAADREAACELTKKMTTVTRCLLSAETVDAENEATGVGLSGNLRLSCTVGLQCAFLSRRYDPTPEQRENGVPVGLLQWEREDPQVKTLRADYVAAVGAKLGQPGPFGNYFELLLADHAGRLTEGSRANLFFLKEGRIYSAPEDRVLQGITRRYVLGSIEQIFGGLVSEALPVEEVVDLERGLPLIEGAFITGSPIDVLPIRAIESVLLPEPIPEQIHALQAAYNRQLDEYVAANKEFWRI
ncbi:MAG: aminotransferase class IV [Clostridiaceae bacterium]|mgnify:CR=1 FL=1|nr:aminotransferase class IV [Clostridiaceae bacterium]